LSKRTGVVAARSAKKEMGNTGGMVGGNNVGEGLGKRPSRREPV